jgi:hypothetical protein
MLVSKCNSFLTDYMRIAIADLAYSQVIDSEEGCGLNVWGQRSTLAWRRSDTIVRIANEVRTQS